MLNKDQPKENWAKRAIVYQVYPRSFFDTNSDGVGDIRGIIRKLDYLNDGTEHSLGVNVLWLNPIYKSPQHDFGYDVSGYYEIDPIFGDFQTFTRLVEELHRRGMRLIMDFVPNHTSIEHPWFIESRASRDNPKREWYIWRDPKADGSPPNNWLSVFGGSAWTLDEATGQYYLHSFLASQPDLNWRSEAVKSEMVRILKYWIHRGVDGFRTDAVYHLIKDNQFRDDPPNPNFVPGRDEPYDALTHTYSTGQNELYETTNALCRVLGAHEDTFMVSEAYLDVPAMDKMYGACENNLHAPLNFNLMSLEWEAKKFRAFIDEFEGSLKSEDVPNYVLGNHDRPRIATRFGHDRARLAAMLLFMLRGMPFIYYGDELGMENVPIANTLDPWGKQVPSFGVGRDPVRTPMQWTDAPHAGFSDVAPWLPVPESAKRVNVAVELKDPRSILSLYRTLIHLRRDTPALTHGSYRSIDSGNEHVFAFLREEDGTRFLILLNFSDVEAQLACAEVQHGTVVVNTYLDRQAGSELAPGSCTLRPNEGCVVAC